MFRNLYQLAVSFFKIGLFNYGGGLAMIPLILKELEQHQWMTKADFFNFFSISQMTPGAIAMNTASYVGGSVAGIPGSIIATGALATPSVAIMLILAGFLNRMKNSKIKDAIFSGLKPVTVSLILYAGLLVVKETHFYQSISIYTINWKAVILSLICAACLIWLKKLNPILLLLFSGLIGLLIF